jgi:hypothetical protein
MRVIFVPRAVARMMVLVIVAMAMAMLDLV